MRDAGGVTMSSILPAAGPQPWPQHSAPLCQTCLAAGEWTGLLPACKLGIYKPLGLSVRLCLLGSQVCLSSSALINMLSPPILRALLAACSCLLSPRVLSSSSYAFWFCYCSLELSKRHRGARTTAGEERGGRKIQTRHEKYKK